MGEKEEDSVKNEDVIMKSKEIRKRSVQSIALDNAFDILNFEIQPLPTVEDEEETIKDDNEDKHVQENIAEKEEDSVKIEDVIMKSKEIRKRSVQSIALDNAFDILDF